MGAFFLGDGGFLVEVRGLLQLGMWYSGRSAGPGGADGVANGAVFSQATDAVWYSGLNRRTSIA